jgi:mRNA-degrading endonuclease toxin of MazEF toxin-antitoxin module
VPTLDAGSVVWIKCDDPQGRNRKVRPVVVLTAAADIAAGSPVIGVAVTTDLPKPLPATHVPLPWSRPKHPRTSLTGPCAAHCGWAVSVPADAVPAGHILGPALRQIVDKVAALAQAQPKPAAPLPERRLLRGQKSRGPGSAQQEQQPPAGPAPEGRGEAQA